MHKGINSILFTNKNINEYTGELELTDSLLSGYLSYHKTLCLAADQCHDGKFSIKKLSIALACNSTVTEKLKPIIIVKRKNPRCLETKILKSFSFYRSNNTSWVTTLIFTDGCKKIDTFFKSQRKHTLMLLDNCSPHPSSVGNDLSNINYCSLHQIRLLFFNHVIRE